jgi:hypothetical protein
MDSEHTHFTRRLSAVAVSLALGLMAGCAAGPDFQRPEAPQASGYTPEPLAAQTASANVVGGILLAPVLILVVMPVLIDMLSRRGAAAENAASAEPASGD